MLFYKSIIFTQPDWSLETLATRTLAIGTLAPETFATETLFIGTLALETLGPKHLF